MFLRYKKKAPTPRKGLRQNLVRSGYPTPETGSVLEMQDCQRQDSSLNLALKTTQAEKNPREDPPLSYDLGPIREADKGREPSTYQQGKGGSCTNITVTSIDPII